MSLRLLRLQYRCLRCGAEEERTVRRGDAAETVAAFATQFTEHGLCNCANGGKGVSHLIGWVVEEKGEPK